MAKKKKQKKMNNKFLELSEKISKIGLKHHKKTLLNNAKINSHHIQKSINDIQSLKGDKKKSGIVISAGPSLHKLEMLKKIKDSDYTGSIISRWILFKMFKKWYCPDYVLTLDPHETRMVRWFGDPEFEKNTLNDDYFDRQDLDEEFRNNSVADNLKNIDLVNKFAKKQN